MPQHSEISDPNLHEPKGISTAADGTVYIADGAGSGLWELPSVSERFTLTATMADVSTAGSVYIPVPVDCTILGAVTCLQAAITTANSSVTFFRNAATSLGSAMTVAFTSSAAGDVDTFTATTNTAATAGEYIRVVSDGGSSSVAPLVIVIICSRTASA